MEPKAALSLEEALLRELRFGGLDKDNLKEMVGIVAGLQRAGMKGVKAFPRGIPPIVDGLRICGTIDASNANQFLANILTKTPRMSGVEIFPYGIPWPEIFQVNVDLGNPVQTGPINKF